MFEVASLWGRMGAMSRESLVFLFGLIVFFTSFLGVPSDYKKTIFTVSGAVLMIAGYSLRRSAFLRSLENGSGERKADAFVESMGAPSSTERSPETRDENLQTADNETR